MFFLFLDSPENTVVLHGTHANRSPAVTSLMSESSFDSIPPVFNANGMPERSGLPAFCTADWRDIGCMEELNHLLCAEMSLRERFCCIGLERDDATCVRKIPDKYHKARQVHSTDCA